jgi:hypothetical protein
MPKRTMLLVSALILGTLPFVAAAKAGDSYGGFGPSDTDTPAAGSNPSGGAPNAADQTTGPEQEQDQTGSYGNDGSAQGAADGDEQLDDESGH